ncbi:MAG: sugar-phospahte nucleotidyltransferase [Proteobacteria bacterium]|nr:sugar-phospahte nucleotidyltransferase [Pseudomonadota bacterium]
MKLDKITNKNDECYTPNYAITPILKYIPKGSKIWCPFDTKQSNFVKMFLEHDYEVIATHLDTGQDFFDTLIECDYIISNPPYSIKGLVFERLFEIGKPFAMLVGVVGLFESQHRFDIFKNNNFEIMYFNRRISYLENYSDNKARLNPPFSSVYVTSGMLPEKIVFETLDKSDNLSMF